MLRDELRELSLGLHPGCNHVFEDLLIRLLQQNTAASILSPCYLNEIILINSMRFLEIERLTVDDLFLKRQLLLSQVLH
jgi:hypothetical protein